MSPLPLQLTAALSATEAVSLAAVVVGLVVLLVARVVGRSESITHRAYGKLYSGAPGADTESKPDAR